MKKTVFDPTLYFVTDSTGWEETAFLRVVDSACAGGVSLVQLREKEKGGAAYLRLAQKVKLITDAYQIPLVIDDRVDVALACGAAGVHVGKLDLPVAAARDLMGEQAIVGATAKTPEQARDAIAQGASYLGVGAIYPTTTKVVTVITEVSTLNEICALSPAPVVAIGGLNPGNMDVLKDSPIAGVAVVSAIMKSADARRAAREIREKVLAFRAARQQTMKG